MWAGGGGGGDLGMGRRWVGGRKMGGNCAAGVEWLYAAWGERVWG